MQFFKRSAANDNRLVSSFHGSDHSRSRRIKNSAHERAGAAQVGGAFGLLWRTVSGMAASRAPTPGPLAPPARPTPLSFHTFEIFHFHTRQCADQKCRPIVTRGQSQQTKCSETLVESFESRNRRVLKKKSRHVLLEREKVKTRASATGEHFPPAGASSGRRMSDPDGRRLVVSHGACGLLTSGRSRPPAVG